MEITKVTAIRYRQPRASNKLTCKYGRTVRAGVLDSPPRVVNALRVELESSRGDGYTLCFVIANYWTNSLLMQVDGDGRRGRLLRILAVWDSFSTVPVEEDR